MSDNSSEFADKVSEQQIRMLYENSTPTLVAGFFTGSLAVFSLWNVADRAYLIVWLLGLVLLYFCRVFSAFVFRRRAERVGRWLNGFVVMNFAAGCYWAGLAYLYDPQWPVANQVIIWLIFTGVASGSMSTFSPVFVSFVSFYFPLWLSMVLILVARQDLEHMPVLILLHIFWLVAIHTAGIRQSRTLKESIEAKFSLQKVNEQLSLQASLDPLTNMFNRRAFDSKMDEEWTRHKRDQSSLAVLMIDIDHFKQFNDEFGHDAGDHCIKEVAELLKRAIKRSGDTVARYGGEEFIALLSNTDHVQALMVAKKINASIVDLKIPQAPNSQFDVVTVSVGVSSVVPKQEDSPEELFKRADENLYKAKHNGRNCVV